jgi:hypothetical protein
MIQFLFRDLCGAYEVLVANIIDLTNILIVNVTQIIVIVAAITEKRCNEKERFVLPKRSHRRHGKHRNRQIFVVKYTDWCWSWKSINSSILKFNILPKRFRAWAVSLQDCEDRFTNEHNWIFV